MGRRLRFSVLTLSLPVDSPSEFERVGPLKLVKSPRCECCGTELNNLQQLPPYHFEIVRGRPHDFLTDGMVFAVSERCVEAFRNCGLTGLDFSTEPIQLSNCRDSYFMATPVCTRTLLDEAASGVVIDRVRGCENCRVMALHAIKRIVIREETWSGWDVFTCGNLFSEILVSERFVNLIADFDLEGFSFIPQDQFQFDYRFPGQL